jgi:hypothetical protein
MTIKTRSGSRTIELVVAVVMVASRNAKAGAANWRDTPHPGYAIRKVHKLKDFQEMYAQPTENAGVKN